MSQITTLINRLCGEPYRLSQSEIFRLTKIPQPRLSRWAAGDVPAGVDDALKLIALAKQVGIPDEELPKAPDVSFPSEKAGESVGAH